MTSGQEKGVAGVRHSNDMNFFMGRGERRSGIERRAFSYDVHVPERRAAKDRRTRTDRRSGRDRRSGEDRRGLVDGH